MSKFYPMTKTNEMCQAIQAFKQRPTEQFCEAWGRFQDYINSFPHQGLEKSRLVHGFYNGLIPSSCTMIESMYKGKFMHLTPTAAYNFLLELGDDFQDWEDTNAFLRSDPPHVGNTYEAKNDPNFKTFL